MLRPLLTAVVCLVAACGRPSYDTATPEATLDAAVEMVDDGDARSIPFLIEIPARDITFDDGVTEASAIAEVKTKAGEMLMQLLRVAKTLRRKFPGEVDRELKAVLLDGGHGRGQVRRTAARVRRQERREEQRGHARGEHQQQHAAHDTARQGGGS